MDAMSLLDKVLAEEAMCQPMTHRVSPPQKPCVIGVRFPQAPDTSKIGRNQLIQLVRNSVLLEAQTNVQIPRHLEVALNTAVTAGDLDATSVAATAIREHLVAHEAADNPYRTWQP